MNLKEQHIKTFLLSMFFMLLLLSPGKAWADAIKGSDGYYQIKSGDDLVWFSTFVNEGNYSANARLTDNLILDNTAQWTPIGGTSQAAYKGTFDGQDHTIKGLYYNNTNSTTGKNVGLFGYVSGATIKNVKLNVNISANQNIGGICGYATNSTITSCSVSGTLNGSNTTSYTGGICGYAAGTSKIENCSAAAAITAKASTGGICGYAAGTSTIEKCYSIGKVLGTSNVGGICGNASAANVKVSNCYNIGEVSGSGICGTAHASTVIENCFNGIKTTSAISPNGKISECFYLSDKDTQAGGKTERQFSNGYVCYLLNKNCNPPIWTLSEGDKFPSFQGNLITDFSCSHTFENHVCTKCDIQQEPDIVDGYYQLNNAYDLEWFASYVNVYRSGSVSANAKLTQDITIENAWTPIGTSSVNYTGIFDGQGHTIKGLSYSDSKGAYVGLFGYVKGATIQNVKIEEANISANQYVGAICGYATNSTITSCSVSGELKSSNTTGYTGGICGNATGTSTIEKCSANASVTAKANTGGICGYANGSTSIEMCYSTGIVSGTAASTGGICGNANSATVKVSNCYNLGEVSGSGICGKTYNTSTVIMSCYNAGNATASKISPNGKITNCFYLSETITDDGGLTSDYFSTGEVCYLLNNGNITENAVWRQISDAQFPSFEGAVVTNAHKECDEEGKCKVCGAFDIPAEDGGFYLIRNRAQFLWFVYQVNVEKKVQINGKLMDNISLDNSVQWKPIGGTSQAAYKGTFDGQGYTISGLNIDNPSLNYAGLFGYINTATIQNVNLDANISANQYVGGICGYAVNSTISSCSVSGTLNGLYSTSYTGGILGYASSTNISSCTVSGTLSGNTLLGGICGASIGTSKIMNCSSAAVITAKSSAGGICGSASNTSTIEKCYFTGIVSGTQNFTGGICGNAGAATVQVTNCYNLGEVSGSGICGYANKSTVIKNCYNAGTIAGSGAQISPYGKITNCYYVNNVQNMYGGMPSNLFANGTVCGFLNKGETIWFQNGNYPAFTGEEISCNHSGLADHEICSVCGYQNQVEPSKDKDDYYLISQAYQLYWFANQVNNGALIKVNARLTADIVLDKTVQWIPIGTTSNPYVGTFDGKNYTVSGLYINNESLNEAGLFGVVRASTIKNVKVDVDITANQNVGGVVGTSIGSTISECSASGSVKGTSGTGGIVGHSTWSTTIEKSFNLAAIEQTGSEKSYVAGVCGYADAECDIIINNCYNQGTIKNSSSGLTTCAGICGYSEKNSSAQITNCYNVGKLSAQEAFGICQNVSGTNCYYLVEGTGSSENASEKTISQFQSGEVCQLLNSKEIMWKQSVGTSYPSLVAFCDDHVYENGFCTYCGSLQSAEYDGEEYTVANAGQLFWISQKINTNNGETVKVKQIADITINETDSDSKIQWSPIGCSNHPFVGEFNGQGYTISGLYYNDSITSSVGFIGIANGAKVYDVHIKDAYFLGIIVGGICSEMSNGGSIDNCTSEGVVSGNYDVAGIVGSINNSTVNNCINKAQVLCRSSYAAGIAAYARGEVAVSGCENYGSVKSNNGFDIGGIVASSESIEIRNCKNHGAIGSEVNRAPYVAGILGSGGNQQSKIVNCYNDAQITGRSDVAGIVGRFNGGEIVECRNEGIVDATSEYVAGICAEYDNVSSSTPEIVIVDCHNTADVKGTGYVGGICGKISASERKVMNCSNKGKVNSISGASVGGVIGYSESASIVDCANEGNVSSLGEYGRQVGGIAGYCSAPILNCTNTAKVTNTGTLLYTGGICGRFEGGTIKNCHNSGDVESTTEYVAGLCGMISSGKIEDCSNTGRVSSETAKYYAGGLCGHSNIASIINCFNTGDIYMPNTTIVGGLCGGSEGHSVQKSYNTGNITAAGCVGGLVGWIWRNSFIENCYNRGNVKALADSGEAAGLCCVTGGELAPSLKSSYSSGTITGAIVYPLVQNTNGVQSYYLAETTTADGGRTAAQFADGTITALLNLGHSGDAVWFQNGKYPAFEGTPVEDLQLEHLFDNGFCLLHAGEYEPAVLSQTDGYYEIANAGQLYWFAQKVNAGDNTINGRVVADIVINSNVLSSNSSNFLTWDPIGSASNHYSGHFDGGNYTISGMYMDFKEASNQGMFSYCEDAELKNINLADSYMKGYVNMGSICGYAINTKFSDITCSAYTEGCAYVGGIVSYANNCTFENCTKELETVSTCSDVAGICYSGTGSTFNNCKNLGDVRNKSGRVAGLVCQNAISITNCTNKGNITNLTSAGTAGIVVQGCPTLENCRNEGTITGAGGNGVAGISIEGAKTITSCTNTGNILSTAGGEDMGGICARAANGATFTDCHNEGNVSGQKNPIGATGICHYVSEGKFVNCSNSGTIDGWSYGASGICTSCPYATFKDCSNSGNVTAHTYKGSTYYGAAGISAAGTSAVSMTYGTSFENCTNTGAITDSVCSYGAAGIALYGISFSNCKNEGDIYGGGTGVAGICVSNASSIENCTNSGDITANGGEGAAGIAVTSLDDIRIENCYNTGNISNIVKAAGILAYHSMSADISKCFNTGNITADTASSAGIVAQSYSGDLVITDCYNQGVVKTKLPNYKGEIFEAGILGQVSSPIAIEDTYKQTIANCYSSDSTCLNKIAPDSATIVITNCYYLNKDNTTDFANGVIANKLNDGRSGDDIVWYQNGKYPGFELAEEIKDLILNETSIAFDAAKTYETITYTRALSNNWNTICLPFAFNASDCNKGGTAVTFFTVKGIGNDGTVELVQVENVGAGQPVLFYTLANDLHIEVKNAETVGTPANGTYMKGEFAETKVISTGNEYYLKDNQLFQSSSFIIKPFRAYITGAPSGKGLKLVVADDIAEEATETVPTLKAIFNAVGQQVDHMNEKGIYILQFSDGSTRKVHLGK